MKKIFLPFIAIAIMTFFVACSNEELLPEAIGEAEANTETTIEETRTLSITATMPGDEDPKTRVTLERDSLDIVLKWQEEGDRLQFAFVQGENKVRKIIELSEDAEVSNNGKTVTFDIVVPDGIDAAKPFDLYGLYSNYRDTDGDENLPNGISAVNPTKVFLTRNPGKIKNTLQQVQDRGDVMLYFESMNIDLDNPITTVEFKHLGSLFSVSFNNITQDLDIPNVNETTKVRLVGVDNDGEVLENNNWAYNNGDGGQIFDLVSGEFEDISKAGNYISFATAGSSLDPGAITTLWAWYPPIPNQKWPALKLQLTRDNGTVILESTNIKPVRDTAPEAGKSYYFYASFNANNTLSFVEPFALD